MGSSLPQDLRRVPAPGRTFALALAAALAFGCRRAPAPSDAGHGGATSAAPSKTGALPPLRERVRFGAYAHGLPYETEAFYALERDKLGQKLEIASGFVDWEYVFGGERDQELSAGGTRTLLYSWEPHCRPDGSCIRFRDVIDGKLDAYLERVAVSMKAFGHDLYVRPWGEMNASWSPWRPGSTEKRAGTIDEFKEAFRYLHDFFAKRGVRNLKLVFNPDASMESTHVPVAELWPGKGYVDVLGIDGYNWGESGQPGGNVWQEFEEIFAGMYGALTALDPSLPVWVCEFGSKEPTVSDGSQNSPAPVDPNHDKARWLHTMMDSRAFPKLEALVYFDVYMPNRDNQRDWRFDSSPAALAAIREELALRRAARGR
jgi:Glycosyl hydrolase family 26